MDFFSLGWLLFNSVIAGAVGFYLVSNRKILSTPKKMYSIFIITTVLHQNEEYAMPGGFPPVFNLGGGAAAANMMGYPLSPMSAMVTNAGFILMAVFILWKYADKAWALIFIPLFGISQLVGHIQFALTALDVFGDYGYTLFYSPGIVAVIVTLMPLGVWAIVHMVRERASFFDGAKDVFKSICISLLPMAIMGGVLVMGPIAIFRNPEPTYYFKNAGIYERYVEEYRNTD